MAQRVWVAREKGGRRFGEIPNLCLQVSSLLVPGGAAQGRDEPCVDTVQALPHLNAVATDDDHANVVLLRGAHDLDGVVQDDVHELVVTAKGSNDVAVPVHLDVETLL